ncbi:MAG TPA: cell division protein FtsL [Peptococcaceae bacterium]|nr:cell division protein FtsL [Peptococcaceae bacterium]
MVLAEKKSVSYQVHQEPQNRKRLVRKISLKTYFRVVVLILSCFAMGLFYTSRHARIVALGYEIESLQHEINSLQKENLRLELEIAKLQAPERIEKIARTKLGMKEPEEVLLATLPPSFPTSEEKTESNEAKWKRKLLLVAQKFAGKAEASPR